MSNANPFGSDLWLGVQKDGSLDIDPTMREVSGLGVLAQSLAMAQLTPPDSCIGAPGQCIDIRQFLSKGTTQSGIQQLVATSRQQLLRDQRVRDVTITSSFVFQTSTLTLVEQVDSLAGPFTLTITIDKLMTTLLLNGVPLGGAT